MKKNLNLLHISNLLILIIIINQTCLAQPIHTTLIDSSERSHVFAPGIFSTPYTEWSLSLSPDGNTAYSSMGDIYWTIICAHKVNSVWQRPEVVPFSGRFRDTDPFITPDGSKLFFISSRPFLPGAPANIPQKVTHIWYVEHTKGGSWDSPHHLDSVINLTDVNNFAPSVSAKGTLYYCSRRNGLNGMQSFYVEWLGDHYAQPLQVIIKGAKEIQDPFIAPDESCLVYLDGNDICISFREGEGWSAEEKLGPEVNNGSNNSSPYISADGKILYYTSDRIDGFHKRDLNKPAIKYDDLVKENSDIFNRKGNIWMIPIHLPSVQKN